VGEKEMNRKIIGIFIVCLFIVTILIPTISSYEIIKTCRLGRTFYVGGDGPSNYTRIQDAIDYASDGDLVYVFNDSSPYYESLVINKSIILFGEDKYSTVIDSNVDSHSNDECCITITDDFVSVSGFTLTNRISGSNKGVDISSICENVVISNNIIKNTNQGIYVEGGCNNRIDGNIIMDVIGGINIRDYANNNIISNNSIINSRYKGIEIRHFSSFNTVTRNKIIKGICSGIELYDSTENNIFLNSIEIIDSNWIFIIVNSFDNTISQNNFIINGFYHVISIDSDNIWDGNYWGKSMILPRFIPIYHDNYILPYIFDLDVDWHPVKEPYDIPIPDVP